MMMRMFSSSSPRSRRLAPRRKRAAAPTLGVIAFVALCIYSLTFNIKLHNEAEKVSVGLRPESDVAPVPVQTSNATITNTLSPPATKEKTALDNHGKKKPILYLHAGPPKTATSTIQAKLFELQKNLSKDGIVFLGRAKSGWYLNSFPHVAHCPMYRRYAEKADGISPNCFSKMNETLQSYYHSGKDIIISDEVVGIMYSGKEKKEDAKRSTQAMQDFADLVRDWDVRILLGYRPYFDFVISQFNEQWEIKAAKVKMNRWPKNGGKSVPLVKDSWSSNTGLADGGWPATADMADFFSKTFANVTVFDITNPGDLSTHFFCNILENANEACAAQKALVASGPKQTRVNVANPLDYDMLATAASAKGLFSTDRCPGNANPDWKPTKPYLDLDAHADIYQDLCNICDVFHTDKNLKEMDTEFDTNANEAVNHGTILRPRPAGLTLKSGRIADVPCLQGGTNDCTEEEAAAPIISSV